MWPWKNLKGKKLRIFKKMYPPKKTGSSHLKATHMLPRAIISKLCLFDMIKQKHLLAKWTNKDPSTSLTCTKGINNEASVPARNFCLRAKVTPTTHFWGPDNFFKKGPMYQYLSNMQKRRNSWKVKEMKMAIYLKLTWSIPVYTQ